MNNESSEAAVIEKKGQNLIFFVIFIYIFNEVVVSPLTGQFNIVRLLLTLGLIYLLYDGHNWVRVLTGLLSGLSGVVGIVVVVSYGDMLPGLWIGLLFVMSILNFVAGSILLFSQSAITFLKSRRVRPKSQEAQLQTKSDIDKTDQN